MISLPFLRSRFIRRFAAAVLACAVIAPTARALVLDDVLPANLIGKTIACTVSSTSSGPNTIEPAIGAFKVQFTSTTNYVRSATGLNTEGGTYSVVSTNLINGTRTTALLMNNNWLAPGNNTAVLFTLTVIDTQGFVVGGFTTSEPSNTSLTNGGQFDLGAASGAPTFTGSPVSQTAVAGGSVTLSSAAAGTGIAYQWYFNTIAISGATGASYTFVASAATAGSYTVKATNSGGSVTSPAAVIAVSTGIASAYAGSYYGGLYLAVNGGAEALSASFTAFISAAGVVTGDLTGSVDANGVITFNSNSYGLITGAIINQQLTAIAGSISRVYRLQALGGPAPTSVPQISVQPVTLSVATGSTAVFGVLASGAASYQWRFNGAAISGANYPRYVLANATAAKAGAYTCLISNSFGSTLSAAAALTVSSSTNPGRLINLSVLTAAGPADQILTVGFVTGGNTTTGFQPLLLRGIGPALGGFNIPSPLADPILSLFSGSSVLSTNDNWSAGNPAAVANANSATGAFPLVGSSLDAALVLQLAGGGYTMQVTGNNAGRGNALAEVYDNTTAGAYALTSPRLLNLSSRTNLAAGSILTGGFVVGGSTGKTVLLRGIGPTLTAFSVPGVMADPQLSLHTTVNGHDVVLASNFGWGGDAQITAADTAVNAFALGNPSSRDSALLVTLSPGNYSVQATSASGAGGNVLIEVYEVP